MHMKYETLDDLYQYAIFNDKLSEDYAVLFVYNDASIIKDSIHSIECVEPLERDMILRSFSKSVRCVYAINSEHEFIRSIDSLMKKHKNILVYSMAQDINGIGRRCLIPLLCNYFQIINISSDMFSSAISGNKMLMHQFIENYSDVYLPTTLFIDGTTEIYNVLGDLKPGKYIVKPNDESASIGVFDIDYDHSNRDEINERLSRYRDRHSAFCIQEYINGPEIEVPLIFYNNHYYCPGVCELKYSNEISYLNYDAIGMNAYTFQEYCGKLTNRIIEDSMTVARILGFKTICRIDFRIKNDIPYVIDVGANPTISYHSSTNYLFRKRFNDESAVYRILLYKSLIENGLLKPPFD